MCGHAILALTKLVLDTNMIKKPGPHPKLVIDAPPGQIEAQGFRKDGQVYKSAFLNVPSFLLHRDQQLNIDGIGPIRFDVAYGGAFYAIVDTSKLDVQLTAAYYGQLIEWGQKIKRAVAAHYDVRHPFEEDLSFLYGVIFTGRPHHASHHSRNVCIFANGEVDRSATGSGVSARAALHFAKGELVAGHPIRIESILGTTMDVEVVREVPYGPHAAIVPRVTGSAWFTGRHEFWIPPNDPLKEGFIFR